MTLFRSVTASALAISAAACTPQPPPPTPPAVASAIQQLPPGRIYVFHSTPQSSCPAQLLQNTAPDALAIAAHALPPANCIRLNSPATSS